MAIELKIYMLKSPDTNAKGCFIGAWLGSESISQQSLIGNQRCCKTKDGKMHKEEDVAESTSQELCPRGHPNLRHVYYPYLGGIFKQNKCSHKIRKVGDFSHKCDLFICL